MSSTSSAGLVSQLFIYPLKSAQAQKLETMHISASGPEGDRQWMLIDENGTFLSQRTVPRLATVQVLLNEQGLNLGLGKQFFVAPAASAFKRPVSVDVFGHKFEAALEAALFSQAISQYLGVNCRLVRYAPFSNRRVGEEREQWKTEVRFSDSRPLLLLNSKSFEDLNTRLSEPVTIDRLRGNIIYDGVSAYEEDAWSRIQIGDVVFSQPKKCARCKIVTIDQATGTSSGPEPLKTLSSYRRDGNKVQFGVLWIPENAGSIKRGDSIQVLC